MKIIALMGAGLLAAGTLAVVPANAQRYSNGRHDGGYGYGGGYRDGYGYRGGDGYRGGPRWRGGHRWDRGPRWHRGSRWGRGGYGRVTCRGGYYGRECYRTFR